MPKCDFNKLESNFIEITLRHGYSPVYLMHISRAPFLKNTFGWLRLRVIRLVQKIYINILRKKTSVGSEKYFFSYIAKFKTKI